MTAGTFALPLVGPSPSSAVKASAAVRRAGLRQFICGGENRVVEAAARWALEPVAIPFNPLVFYGPSGVGKSHVAIGLVRAWKACFPLANVVYMPATDLCRWMQRTDQSRDTPPERRQGEHRTADYLVIDNLDSIAQSPAAQQELVHAINTVSERGGRIVVTATVDPARNRKLAPPLRSRLAAGLVVPVCPPGSAARERILRELATAYGIALSACCVRLLADACRWTAPMLLGTLLQLELEARSDGRTIDEPQVTAFLARQPEDRALTVETITMAVARHFQVPIDELRSTSRKRTLVLARGVAIYLARKHTGSSFVALGRWLGGRDHTTVMHAYEKTTGVIAADATVAAAVRQLETLLEAEQCGRTGETVSARRRPVVSPSPPGQSHDRGIVVNVRGKQ